LEWLSENAQDLSRIALALETIAQEIARIRATMEVDEMRKEDRG
jgi:hypothetical protein